MGPCGRRDAVGRSEDRTGAGTVSGAFRGVFPYVLHGRAGSEDPCQADPAEGDQQARPGGLDVPWLYGQQPVVER